MSLVGNSGKCWVEFVVEGGGKEQERENSIEARRQSERQG